MDVFPLLLPFFVVPGIDALPPTDLYVDGDVVAFDQELGSGQLAGPGEVAGEAEALDRLVSASS